MRKQRLISFIASGLEIIRFFILFFTVLFFLNPMLIYGKGLLILLFCSGVLMYPAGFFFLGLDPAKYGNFVKLLALGKITGLIPLLLIILSQIPVLSYLFLILFESAKPGLINSDMLILSEAQRIIFLVIFLVDLILLIFLLLFRVKPELQPDEPEQKQGPGFEIIQVEEE